jgi:hypothetical protein
MKTLLEQIVGVVAPTQKMYDDEPTVYHLTELDMQKLARLLIDETHFTCVVQGVNDVDEVMKHFGLQP